MADKEAPGSSIPKKLDTTLAKKYGWKSKYNLSKGFDLTYKDFIKKINN